MSSLGLGFGTLSHFPTSVLSVSPMGNGIETFASHELHISLKIHWTSIVVIKLATLTIHCIYCVMSCGGDNSLQIYFFVLHHVLLICCINCYDTLHFCVRLHLLHFFSLFFKMFCNCITNSGSNEKVGSNNSVETQSNLLFHSFNTCMCLANITIFFLMLLT